MSLTTSEPSQPHLIRKTKGRKRQQRRRTEKPLTAKKQSPTGGEA